MSGKRKTLVEEIGDMLKGLVRIKPDRKTQVLEYDTERAPVDDLDKAEGLANINRLAAENRSGLDAFLRSKSKTDTSAGKDGGYAAFAGRS